MILWKDFLRKLQEDGVVLGEVEHELLDESGERVTAKVLTRRLHGKLLWIEIGFQTLDDRVPRRTQRQIANRLRLPPERYVFEES